MNDNRLIYVGDFECVSSSLDVLDTHLCPVNILEESIPMDNERTVHIRRVLCGYFKCYHLVDRINSVVSSFIAIHSGYNIDDIRKLTPENKGSVSTHIGNNVGFVDGCYTFDTKHLYYPIMDDALYDISKLQEDLPNLPYANSMKDNFSKLIENEKAGRTTIKGETIMNIIQCSPVSPEFADYGQKSNAWSVDCERRVNDSYMPVIHVFRGIVSVAPPGLYNVHVYRNGNGDIIAVSVGFIEN